MKRWIRRIFLAFFVFLLVYIAVIVVVLFTDVPKSLVLKTLNEKYGFAATIESMDIESGKTTIKKLALSLPMEHAPIISVPQITIIHTKIPFVLFGGFKLKQVVIESPVVNVSRDETGTWNLERLMYHFNQGPSNGSSERKNINLPELEIADATLVVSDVNGSKQTIDLIEFKGKSSKLHEWDFQGNIASQIILNGKLSQSGDLSHEVNLEVKSLPKPLQNIIGGISESLQLNAKWKGSIRGNGLSGKLQIDNVQAGNYQAKGTLGIQSSPDGIAIDIEDLVLNGFSKSEEQIKLLTGKLNFSGNQINAKSVYVEAFQNKASITGNWNIEERQGDFLCSVTGGMKEKGIDYENTISGIINWPKNGRSQAEMSVTSNGQMSSGKWQSKAELLGSGDSWKTSKWNVTVPSLVWESEKNSIQLTDLKTEIVADWPKIKLDELQLSNAEKMDAEGEFSAEAKIWNISLEAEKLKLFEDQNTPIDLKLAAQGDMNNIYVHEFTLLSGDLQFEGNGDMSVASKELSNTELKVSMSLSPKDQSDKMLDNITANLECKTKITGKVWPINLQCESVFTAENIEVDKQVIEPLEIAWIAGIDTNMVTYEADEFRLFDGTWSLDGRYDFRRSVSELKLNTEQVSLRPVMKLFELPIECKGVTKVALDVTLPLYDINQMVISGNWSVTDLSIPPIQAKDAQGRIVIQHGTAVFDEIRLMQGLGLAQGDAWFRLNQPQLVYVNVDAEKWPMAFNRNNIALTSNANGSASLDLSKGTIKGKGNITTDIALVGEDIGNVSAQINIEERLLDFNDMTINTLGGVAKGDVSIPFEDWTSSKATLDWNDIDLAELENYYPQLTSVVGKSSGSIIIKPAESKRAYEPIQIDVNGIVTEGNFRNAELGNFKVSAYLGSKRIVIDKAEIDTMNGLVKSYGNVTRQAGSYSIYLNTEVSKIETNQLLHSFIPNAKPVLGNLSGKGMLVIFSDLHSMTGDVNIQITESDLAQTQIFSTLYNTMNLKFGKNEPSGQGEIRVRFEGSSLHIPSFQYFNRGVEIRGSGSIEDLTKGKLSPVKGYAFGSARPLKGINLVGINELDKLMTSLQKNVASVQVEGTLGDYNVEVVPFKEISDGLRVLLWDQLHSSSN